MGTIRDDLAGQYDEVRETHISWVFLSASEVIKVKKPVALGFLDFRSLEDRKQACDAEVSLNRRLSPDVYHGVVPIVRDAGGNHRVDLPGGETDEGVAVVDYAVHMRRLADANRADRMLERDAFGDEHVERLAQRIAVFHQAVGTCAKAQQFGTPEAIGRNVRENFSQTKGVIQAHLTRAEAADIERFQLGVLEQHREGFTARMAAGRVKDGHGDLRLEHVYFEGEGPPTIIDCIEFNERFRYADTCADVAFLSMDLAVHGRQDLAERFLAAYAREADDYDLYAVVDFYESYRAYVRGKIATMIAAQDSAPAAVRKRAATEARRYFLLALAVERRALIPPSVVAVGGIIASGKSTIAARLGVALGAPVVDSDRTRKAMIGVVPTQPLHTDGWDGAYDLSFTDRVYDEVIRRAEVVIRSGRPVVIDASFRTRAMRAQARALAERHGVGFRLVECQAPIDVCRGRLRTRADQVTVSDGRLEIFDAFLSRWEPIEELSAEEHLPLDTTRTERETFDILAKRLSFWPDGLPG